MGLLLAALLLGHGGWTEYHQVDVVAISPDQKHLAAGTSLGVFLIDLDSGKVRKKIDLGHPYSISSLSFSPSGRYLCATSSSTILVSEDDIAGDLVLYDVAKQEQKFRYASRGPIRKAAFFPAEDGLAVVSDSELLKFDLTGQVEIKTTIYLQPTQRVNYFYVAGEPATIYFSYYHDSVVQKNTLITWEPKKDLLRRSYNNGDFLAADPALDWAIHLFIGGLERTNLWLDKGEKQVRVRMDMHRGLPLPGRVTPRAIFSKDGKHLYVAMNDEDNDYPVKIVDWELSTRKVVNTRTPGGAALVGSELVRAAIGRFRRSDGKAISAFTASDDLIVLAAQNSKIEVWNRKMRILAKVIDLDPQ